MKSLLIIFAATALLLIVSSSNSFAGAWTQPRHGFYEKLAFNYYYADHTFDSSRDRNRTPNHGEFTDYNISNYFEIGLTDRVTVINSLTYKWLENDTLYSHARDRGIGDIDFGARFKLFDGIPGIISTQLLVKIPGPYEKNDTIPLGNDQEDLEGRLLYGRSLYPLIPGYCNFEAGYRWRADEPSDEFRYLGEFGVDFTSAFYGRAKLDGILSNKNGSKVETSGNPTATYNYDLGKMDLTMGYKIRPSWGLEASYINELYGKNTASGSTFTLAVFFKTP